ncbi:MAG: gliding motility-associated C-terminal domain-containing protein [Mucilaginibacter sp.]
MRYLNQQLSRIIFFLLLIIVPVVLKAQTSQTVTVGTATSPVSFPVGTCNYRWTNDNPLIGISSAGIGNIPSFIATNNTSAPITGTFTVTPIIRTLAYIPNSTSGTVSVLDSYSQSAPIVIPTGVAPIGVAISPDNTRVYISDIITGTISVIDAATNTVSSAIPGASAPMGMAITPDGKYLYVANTQSNDIWKINTATKSITPITTTHPSELMVMHPDGSKVYAIHSGVVTVIDVNNNTVLNNITIDPVTTISAAISPDGNNLYIGNNTPGYIQLVNTITNSASPIISLGLTSASGMAISPDGKTLYISLGGTNISSDGTKLTVTYSGFRTVAAVNTSSLKYVATNLGGNFDSFRSLSLSPDGQHLFIVHNSNTTKNGEVSDVNVSDVTAAVIEGLYTVQTDPFPIGNFVTAANSCGPPVKFTITVNPVIMPPAINITGAPSSVNTVYGTPSSSTSFNVSGSSLTAGIVVTPPLGFEVSADNLVFTNTVTIGSTGTVSSSPVYIRLKQTTFVGSYSGNITLTSTGAANGTQTMPASTVTPAPLTITADNKTKISGEVNPVLTLSYSEFVNNEGIAQLTTLPTVTTAVTQASPVGTYPITVSGGSASNYSFRYVNGVLTVTPPPIIIPNAFTPNGDGINDTWNINNLNAYPKTTVEILNRYGTRVYFSNNYPIPWDGKYNGGKVPSGTYYYIITGVNSKPLAGYVAVIR